MESVSSFDSLFSTDSLFSPPGNHNTTTVIEEDFLTFDFLKPFDEPAAVTSHFPPFIADDAIDSGISTGHLSSSSSSPAASDVEQQQQCFNTSPQAISCASTKQQQSLCVRFVPIAPAVSAPQHTSFRQPVIVLPPTTLKRKIDTTTTCSPKPSVETEKAARREAASRSRQRKQLRIDEMEATIRRQEKVIDELTRALSDARRSLQAYQVHEPVAIVPALKTPKNVALYSLSAVAMLFVFLLIGSIVPSTSNSASAPADGRNVLEREESIVRTRRRIDIRAAKPSSMVEEDSLPFNLTLDDCIGTAPSMNLTKSRRIRHQLVEIATEHQRLERKRQNLEKLQLTFNYDRSVMLQGNNRLIHRANQRMERELLKRRNDTFYFISLNNNLHPPAYQNATMRPRLTLLIPAPDSALNSTLRPPVGKMAMMQLDCDVTDIQIIHFDKI